MARSATTFSKENQPAKRPVGRPIGSKNKPKSPEELRERAVDRMLDCEFDPIEKMQKRVLELETERAKFPDRWSVRDESVYQTYVFKLGEYFAVKATAVQHVDVTTAGEAIQTTALDPSTLAEVQKKMNNKF